jgi:hypothetical protein
LKHSRAFPSGSGLICWLAGGSASNRPLIHVGDGSDVNVVCRKSAL